MSKINPDDEYAIDIKPSTDDKYWCRMDYVYGVAIEWVLSCLKDDVIIEICPTESFTTIFTGTVLEYRTNHPPQVAK